MGSSLSNSGVASDWSLLQQRQVVAAALAKHDDVEKRTRECCDRMAPNTADLGTAGAQP